MNFVKELAKPLQICYNPSSRINLACRGFMILGIYGAGGLGKEVLELVNQINKEKQRWAEIVFIDDVNPNRKVKNHNVYSYKDVTSKYKTNELEFVIGVGEPFFRREFYNKIISDGYNLPVLIHPDAHIPEDSVIKSGAIVFNTSYISCNIEVGENSYIHQLTSIGHGSKIAPHCVISNHVSIAGDCKIGDATYIATGVMIKQKVSVGSDTIIGMGAGVFKDIENDVVALGTPATVIRKNENHRVFS